MTHGSTGLIGCCIIPASFAGRTAGIICRRILRLGRFINTPTNHAMHHEFIRGNYGLYFNYWDRLMGINHAQYEQRFAEVTSRMPSKDAG